MNWNEILVVIGMGAGLENTAMVFLFLVVRGRWGPLDCQLMTKTQIMEELKKLGSEQTKKTLLRHGAVEPLFGVKIGDLKGLVKAHRNDHALALELYATGNSDAMYLAGLIADKDVVTKAELNRWAREATWGLIAGSTVAGLAAESKHALSLAERWITSPKEFVASCGWNTMTHYLSIADNDEIDHVQMKDLLDKVVKSIHEQPNEIKAAMNGFVIAAGSYLPKLTASAKAAAKKIGTVEVDQGNTACKTPDAVAYIEKIEGMGRIGKKRKKARC